MSNVIFKKFELIGTTKDEAKAQTTMNLMVDATGKYNKWAKKNSTDEASVKEWMKNYLHEKKYDKPGLGAYIVIQTGLRDTRERPYQFEKIKYEARTHSFQKMYVIRDRETNEEMASVKTSKEAEAVVKELIIANHKSYDIYVEAKVKEKNSLYAKGNYTPSKGAQPYKLLAFGYESVD